jgi:uncharacterized protein YqgC (DUF456 family)
MAAQTLLFVLAARLILTGLAGTVLPILPGVPLVFAGMWLAAATDHYQHVGTFTLIILGALTVFALLIDFVASIAGAKRVGATGRAIWGASIGMIVGIFFGLPGLLLGPFIGALIGELSSGSTMHQATRVGIGTWIGLLFGTLAKIALCFTMLGVFALAFIF